MIGHTPRKAAQPSHLHTSGGSDPNLHARGTALQSSGPGSPSSEPGAPSSSVALSGTVAVGGFSEDQLQDVTLTEEEDEREQRLIYLRQAFCGFFRAKQGVEMQNLARVMCAILGVGEEEQVLIMDSIARLVPALVATTTLESLSYNFSSLFS